MRKVYEKHEVFTKLFFLRQKNKWKMFSVPSSQLSTFVQKKSCLFSGHLLNMFEKFVKQLNWKYIGFFTIQIFWPLTPIFTQNLNLSRIFHIRSLATGPRLNYVNDNTAAFLNYNGCRINDTLGKIVAQTVISNTIYSSKWNLCMPKQKWQPPVFKLSCLFWLQKLKSFAIFFKYN